MEGRSKMREEASGAGDDTGGARWIRMTELALRVAALLLALTSAVVLGISKETKIVSLALFPNAPPINVPVSAKPGYMSALVYLEAVNAVVCTYALISTAVSLVKSEGRKKLLRLLLIVLDLAVVAMLFSGAGAASAIGVIAYRGNSHVHWGKVCNQFSGFCRHVAAGIVLSLLAGLSFILLVPLHAIRLWQP